LQFDEAIADVLMFTEMPILANEQCANIGLNPAQHMCAGVLDVNKEAKNLGLFYANIKYLIIF
jgi:hypothetical protein